MNTGKVWQALTSMVLLGYEVRLAFNPLTTGCEYSCSIYKAGECETELSLTVSTYARRPSDAVKKAYNALLEIRQLESEWEWLDGYWAFGRFKDNLRVFDKDLGWQVYEKLNDVWEKSSTPPMLDIEKVKAALLRGILEHYYKINASK